MKLLSGSTEYFLPTEVPWAFRLLVLLVFALLGGGLFLDYTASNVTYVDAIASLERKKDPATGQEITVEKAGLRPEDRQILIDLAKSKGQRLNESAKLLYDLAKIAMGALIASITQLAGTARRRADRDAASAGSA